MSKISSTVMMIAGGSAIFMAANLVVCTVRGVALREAPPLSWFAGQAPPAATPPGSAPAATPAPEPQASAHTDPLVPHLTAGVLGSFVMPSPYDARELQALEQSLKDGLARVAAGEERQKRRERELDDWQHVLQQRAQELAALRKSLDDPSPADASNKGVPAKSAASWRALSPLFEEGDPGDVAVRLGQLEPDQAAQVLRGLDSDRCAALLNALPKERYKSFLDAWRRVGG